MGMSVKLELQSLRLARRFSIAYYCTGDVNVMTLSLGTHTC